MELAAQLADLIPRLPGAKSSEQRGSQTDRIISPEEWRVPVFFHGCLQNFKQDALDLVVLFFYLSEEHLLDQPSEACNASFSHHELWERRGVSNL